MCLCLLFVLIWVGKELSQSRIILHLLSIKNLIVVHISSELSSTFKHIQTFTSFGDADLRGMLRATSLNLLVVLDRPTTGRPCRRWLRPFPPRPRRPGEVFFFSPTAESFGVLAKLSPGALWGSHPARFWRVPRFQVRVPSKGFGRFRGSK